jgi:Domain of unknown function DUF11
VGIIWDGLRGKHFFEAVFVVAVAWLAIPAAVQAANYDLGVTQTLSTTKVTPGGMLDVESTVTNLGTQPYPEAYVDLGTLRGQNLELGADDPYISFSSSQGSCVDDSRQAFGSTYHDLVCSLGPLAPGQIAQVHASLRANENAVHETALLASPTEGGYSDGVPSNNARAQAFYLDLPPTVSGSKRLKLIGLPQGCVTGDFTLTVKSQVARTKKMRINADLGFDENGSGLLLSKQVKGRKITMKIPASKSEIQLDGSYTLVLKAKLGGGHALTTKIEFRRCF